MPTGVYERKVKGLWNMRRYDPATGCWNFTGNRWRRPNGELSYGLIRYPLGSRKSVSVHRLAAHLWLRFDLDSPLEVLHTCDNPACFNPKHLVIGTQKQNIQQAIERGRFPQKFFQINKTHCSKGHPYSGSNLRISVRDGRQRRICRRCHLESTWKRRGKVIPIGD